MARQFNLIPPLCEQAEHHLFQRDKVEMQLPELYHKIGSLLPHPYLSLGLTITQTLLPMHPILFLLGVGSVTWSPLACGLITSKYEGRVPDTCRTTIKVRFGGSRWQDWAILAVGRLSSDFLWPPGLPVAQGQTAERGWQETTSQSHGPSPHCSPAGLYCGTACYW